MANVVIASNDPLCQSAKAFFKNIGYQEGPPIEALNDNDLLVVIGHDNELGDGSVLIDLLRNHDKPMTQFKVFLIVCSAQSLDFGKELTTPAEKLANYFCREVIASKTVVHGQWNSQAGNFNGQYTTVKPGSDITSLFGKLSIAS